MRVAQCTHTVYGKGKEKLLGFFRQVIWNGINELFFHNFHHFLQNFLYFSIFILNVRDLFQFFGGFGLKCFTCLSNLWVFCRFFGRFYLVCSAFHCFLGFLLGFSWFLRFVLQFFGFLFNFPAMLSSLSLLKDILNFLQHFYRYFLV